MNKKRYKNMKRGLLVIPNLITTANLFCGFFSIIKSISGQFEFAAYLVVLAGFFDFLDGRVARMMKMQSDFGVEYDSLADLTTFCLAPALLAYNFGLNQFGKFGLGACFLYFACGALRLARFNVQSSTVEKVNFQGAPSPTAGGMMVSWVLFHLETMGMPTYRGFGLYVMLGITVGMALLMVSSVEYRSFKKLKRGSFLFLVIVVSAVFLITAQPNIMFFIIGVIYVSIGLIGWLWKSPEKIRGIRALVVRLYNERREDLVYEDEDEDEDEDVKANLALVEEDENRKRDHHG